MRLLHVQWRHYSALLSYSIAAVSIALQFVFHVMKHGDLFSQITQIFLDKMLVTLGSCVYIVDCVLGKEKKYVRLRDESKERNSETSTEGLASLATISGYLTSWAIPKFPVIPITFAKSNYFHHCNFGKTTKDHFFVMVKIKPQFSSSRFDSEKYEQILKKIYDELISISTCPLNSASPSHSIDFDSPEVGLAWIF